MKARPRLSAILKIPGLAAFYRHRFEQPFLFTHGKGGIGSLRSGFWVDLESATNQLSKFGRSDCAWIGSERSVEETVMISRWGVEDLTWRGLLKLGACIVRFTPDRVHLYVLHAAYGGYYLRRTSNVDQAGAADAEKPAV